MPEPGDRSPDPDRSKPPEYNVYRSRRGLLDRFRKPDLSGLSDRLRRGGDDSSKPPSSIAGADEGPRWRRWLKWFGIFVVAWIALSVLAFAISSQIQKGKLADGVDKVLDGGPVLL